MWAAVKRDPAQSLADVEVRPAAALDRSRELMLVWLKENAVLPAGAAETPSAAKPAAAPAPKAPPPKAPAPKALAPGPAPKTTAPKPTGGRTP